MIPLERSAYLRSLALLVSLSLLTIHAAIYIPFTPDDSYISYQYAKRFSEGLGLTWSSGRPVEGYSNFLWVMLLSACASMGCDIVQAARALGVLCMTSVAIALFAIPHRVGDTTKEELYSNFGASLLFVSCGTTAAWAIGGLEQALLGALLAWGILSLFQTLMYSGKGGTTAAICFALLACVRPDTPMFGVLAGVLLLARYGTSLDSYKTPVAVVLATLMAFVALTLFRLWYYGDYVPNTAHVKLSLSSHYLLQGVRYVLRCSGVHFLPLLTLLSFTWISYQFDFRRDRALLLAGLSIGWLGYLIVMGGDVNPPSRHFVPLVVLCCFAASDVLFWLMVEAPREWRREARWLIPLLVLLHLGIQYLDAELRDARSPLEFTQEDALAVGHTLGLAFKEKDPLIALDGAGAVPYGSELRCLDLLGLNDWTIARTPSANFGTGWLGHELGSSTYVLEQSPDLILFGSYKGEWDGAYVSGKALVAHEGFQLLYTKAILQHPRSAITGLPFSSQVWIKTYGRLGVSLEQKKISIPAYLFQPPAPATTIRAGRVIREFNGLERFKITVPPGKWRLYSIPETAKEALYFNRPDKPHTVKLEDPAEVEILTAPRLKFPLLLESIELMAVD
jgi:arabinofuranosyltransferase